MRLLALNGLHFNYGSMEPWIFRDLNLCITPGSCHCITGPTGAGKSTLLRLLAGLHQRPFEGELVRGSGLNCGLVMQDPQPQLQRQTVGAEVALVLEHQGLSRDDMIDRVQTALRRVGLFVALDCPVSQLSLGQKYRLMMAAELAGNASILLLDEPWAQLDDNGIADLQRVISELCGDGLAVVIAEHHPQAFAKVASHFWQLDDGRLLPGCYHGEAPVPPADFLPESPLMLSAAPFELRYPGKPVLLRCEQPLTIGRRELITLVGDNGTGKSSLLKAIAGLQSDVCPLPLKLFGQSPKPGALGQQLGVLMQRPRRQLFEATVHNELNYSLQRFGLPLGTAIHWLESLGLATLAQQSPQLLSHGQQHLVALASQACYRPSLLLLDEPLAGLDNARSNQLWQLVNQLRSKGCSVLVSSHRPLAVAATQTWQLADGQLRVARPEAAQRVG
ncbi:ATP-binding cassette domain-containing protein [Shewanella sp. YIC-542]|uniref:ATP-binding cassette domain-containing protein n=1 Tax=Shewanella mytili TaxID=3377111 RepID=UPI00398EC053